MAHAHLISRILLGLMVVFAGSTAVVAQQEAPGKPIEFDARTVENGTMAKLSWMANREGGDPTSFCIYYAEGETENMDDFELLAETDSPANPNGVYSYLVRQLDPGEYTFYIVAKNDAGDSPRSIIKVLTLEEEGGDGVPGKPVEFSATVIQNGKGVAFRWQTNREGGDPTSFCIYYAEGETENMDDFELLAEVDAKPNSMVHEYATDDLEHGVYTFYVIAKNDAGESKRSIIKVVNLKDPEEPRIWIVSKPENGGKVGQEWTYQIRIEKNFEGSGTAYKLKEGPDGMEINEKTGKVTWPEPVEGRYEIKICVEVQHEGRLIVEDQGFVLEIGDGENKEECAVIFGSVNIDDPTGRPVLEGEVTAWMVRGANMPDNKRVVFSTSFRQGRYVLRVPAGVYRMFVEGRGIYKEWYQDVETADDAKDVVVECDTEKEVNFLVSPRAEQELKQVSGMVYDAHTREPIHNALIIFEYAGERGQKPTENFYRVLAESNERGQYEANLPEGVPYKGHAIARSPNSNRDAYLVEWYDNQHDATLATVIVLDGNRDGVNFSMDKKSDVMGGFGGKMMNHENEEGVPGTIVAYQVDAANSHGGETWIESVETNEKGQYEFNGVPPGEYIILGLPAARPYLPGWHVSRGVAAHSWKEASRIMVDDAMDATPYNVRLEQVTDGIGKGEVGGWVYDKRTGHIKPDVGEVQETEGIAGAIVYAYDSEMNVVDFAMTDAEGSYMLSNLGIGTSTLMADRIGFNPDMATVVISLEELATSVSIGLNPIVTSVEVPIKRVGLNELYNLYPNPAESLTTVSFPSVDGSATVRIVSSTGVVLSTETVTTSSGNTRIQLNTTTLPAGMVMVHVTAGTSTFALPLSIVR